MDHIFFWALAFSLLVALIGFVIGTAVGVLPWPLGGFASVVTVIAMMFAAYSADRG